MKGLPRFQGNAIEKPNGKWVWECMVTIVGEGKPIAVLEPDKEFPTKAWALQDMSRAIGDMCKEFSKDMGGKGEIINMKTNEVIGEI